MEFHELASIFPLMAGNDYTELVESIRVNGLREPIYRYEGKILDGRNRYLACKESDTAPIYIEYTGNDPIKFVIDLNLHRRHLDNKQRSIVAAKLADMGVGNPANSPNSVSQEKAAQLMNVSDRSLRTGKQVQEASPELRDKAMSSGISLQTAADIATLPEAEQAKIAALSEKEILAKAKEIRATRQEKRRVERIEKIVQISKGNTELPDKKYPLIYADPPWQYQFSETDNRKIENHYPTMTLDEICDMDLDKITTDDCILFLWATSPKLQEAMEVIASWNFTYRSSFVWVKDRIGMGYYARQRHELLLVAIKGSIPVPSPGDRLDSVVESPRLEHSSKPEVFYEMIEQMYPALPKLELFARNNREGWNAWGNQYDTQLTQEPGTVEAI